MRSYGTMGAVRVPGPRFDTMFMPQRFRLFLTTASLAILSITAQAQTAQAAAESAPAAASAASAASAPTPVEIRLDDPAMRAAIRKARATLNTFLPIAAKEDPNLQAVSLKVAIREGKTVEHVWITPFTVKGKRFSGTVNDQPEHLTKVKQGQSWSFARRDIVDWMYYDTEAGQMHGNFSTCAKLTKGTKEDVAEMKRMYGLECGL